MRSPRDGLGHRSLANTGLHTPPESGRPFSQEEERSIPLETQQDPNSILGTEDDEASARVEASTMGSDNFMTALEGMGARLRARAHANPKGLQDIQEKVSAFGMQDAGFSSFDEVLVSSIDRESSQRELRRVRETAQARIRSMDQTFTSLRKRRETYIDELKTRSRQFDADVDAAIARQRLRKNAFERRVRNQEATATRRLQELVFECLGEAEKTLERARLCVHFRDAMLRDKLDRTSETLQWKLLLRRLEEDSLGALSLKEYAAPKTKSKHKATWNLCQDAIEKIDNELCVERVASVSYTPRLAKPASGSSVRTSAPPRGGPAELLRRETILADEAGDLKSVLGSLFGDAGIRSKCPLVIDTLLQGGESGDEAKDSSGMPRRSRQSSPTSPPGKLGFVRRSVRHTRRVAGSEQSLLLSARVFSWLLWPSHGQAPIDLRVYFCLEERLSHHGPKDDRCTTLGSIYQVKDSDSEYLKPVLEPTQDAEYSKQWPTNGIRVIRAEGRHRKHYSLSQLKDLDVSRAVAACPDVYITSNPQFHFAPATVRELLGTHQFWEISSRSFSAEDRATLRNIYGQIAHESLRQLYVAMPVQNAKDSCIVSQGDNPNLGEIQLVPIPVEAVEELVRSFVVRANELSSVQSALTLAEEKACYSVVFPARNRASGTSSTVGSMRERRASNVAPGTRRNTLGRQVPVNGLIGGDGQDSTPFEDGETKARPHHAYLLRCVPETDLLENPESHFQTEAAPADVLTHSCLWRACNALRAEDNALGLCSHHVTVYEGLMANENNSTQDIKRHLPRQSLEALRKKTDHGAVIKASSLVSELLTNKLATTVRGFCARAANTSKPRRKSSSSSNNSKSPLLAADLMRASENRERLSAVELELAEMVCAAETQVVKELESMAAFNYFPEEELRVIRQEYKALDEERESLFVNSKPETLFRSRMGFLQREFAKLVDSETDPEFQDNEDDLENNSNALASPQKLKRERHLVEVELELDFSLRKIRILRARRERLEYEANSKSMQQRQRLHQGEEYQVSRGPSVDDVLHEADDYRARQMGGPRRVPQGASTKRTTLARANMGSQSIEVAPSVSLPGAKRRSKRPALKRK